jgi:hypothetical protein
MSDSTVPKTSSILINKLKLKDIETEKVNVKKYFTIDSWQFLIILGIAISGVAALISTYNAIQAGVSDLKTDLQQCTESSGIKSALDLKFWIILVLAVFIVAIGAVLTWFLRDQSKYRLLTLGLITLGIFAILFSIIIKLRTFLFSVKGQSTTIWISLIVSWLVFLAFIILGYAMGRKSLTVSKIKSDVGSTEIGVTENK